MANVCWPQMAAKKRVHEAKLEPSAKFVALRSAMVPALRPSWFASAFGDCELAKDGSAIRRRTLQCLDVFTLSRASCPTPKPCTAETCTCDGVELCTENGRPSQIAGCPEGTAESRWPATGKLYEELGCIDSIASANTSRYMDFACMQSKSTPCRDGLPFFSWVKSDMTAEACFNFCLGKGFDLFGVLSNLECRCGGSAGNEGACCSIQALLAHDVPCLDWCGLIRSGSATGTLSVTMPGDCSHHHTHHCRHFVNIN